jgi:hypothetical protein
MLITAAPQRYAHEFQHFRMRLIGVFIILNSDPDISEPAAAIPLGHKTHSGQCRFTNTSASSGINIDNEPRHKY